MTRPTLKQAQSMYVHRFTCEHLPQWARAVRPDGAYYAPQFATDAEWYENTVFPGETAHPDYPRRVKHCHTTGQTWPLGQSLTRVYGHRA